MISVIVPNYNHALYLKQRIDSVLNQTYQDFELILLDDFSSDNSRDILDLYKENPKVSHVIYNKENSGSPFIQWKKGIELSRGEYIWIAESDDFADLSILETLIKGFEENKNVVLSYSQSYCTDQNGDIRGNFLDQAVDLDNEDLFTQNFFMDGKNFIHQFLLKQNLIPNASGVVFKKEAYLKAGGIDVTVKYCSDWLLWLKILTLGDVYFNHAPLNYFRFHDKSVIAQVPKADNLFFAKYDLIMREYFSDYLNMVSEIDNKIILLNNQYLSEGAFLEFCLFKEHDKFEESILYLFKSLEYADSKLEVIAKFIKSF